MKVNQIAVFLENRKGRLQEFLKVLAEHKIDVYAVTIADTIEFGILRAITSDNAKAQTVLKAAGFTVTATDLLEIEVDDKPGELYAVVEKLSKNDISIEYLYSYSRSDGKGILLVKVDDEKKAKKILEKTKKK